MCVVFIFNLTVSNKGVNPYHLVTYFGIAAVFSQLLVRSLQFNRPAFFGKHFGLRYEIETGV